MSKKEKHSMQDVDKIIRYRSGRMSDSERNSFEKELQKDPFLAEAVDGLSNMSADELQSDFDGLSRRVDRRAKKRTPIFYRIAAAVIVLVGISSILLIRQLKGPELVSDNILPAPSVSEIVEQDKPIKVVEDITEQEKAPEREYIDKEKGLVERSKQLDNPADLQDKTVRVEAEAILLDEVSIKEEVPLVIVTDTNAGIIERKIIDLSNAVEGRVAGVQVEEAKVLTESAAGRESDLNVRSVALAAKKSLGAVSEDIALEEVVVITATGTDDKKESESYIKASPETGLRDFRKYIETNMRFPEEWKSSVREVVRIKFTVSASRTLSNFEIVRSPDTLFSKEAIRLIKEGPSWNTATQSGIKQEESVSLRIVFRRE